MYDNLDKIINEGKLKTNIEGDKEFIDELLEGLDKKQMYDIWNLGHSLMETMNVWDGVRDSCYNNAYKYIAVRRIYKTTIEAYTNKKILGDYKDTISGRWVTLPRG